MISTADRAMPLLPVIVAAIKAGASTSRAIEQVGLNRSSICTFMNRGYVTEEGAAYEFLTAIEEARSYRWRELRRNFRHRLATTVKVCKACGRTLPLSAYQPAAGSHTRHLTVHCRTCIDKGNWRPHKTPPAKSSSQSIARVAAVMKRMRPDDYQRAQRIMTEVAEGANLTTDELISRSRRKPLPEIRATAIKRLATDTNLSMKEIAYMTGLTDHSTVIYWLNKG